MYIEYRVEGGNMFRKLSLLLTIVVATAAWAETGHAQATRTWISGVGDDANPCSRTAPCKTWAGAIPKTTSGGEIDALDPGGFGALTITKSITLDGGGGQVASVLAAGTNGITVAAASTDIVIIRNLRFQGLLCSTSGCTSSPGLIGISFTSGGILSVENCLIDNFSTSGIGASTSVNAILNVTNTNITNAGIGINLAPSAGTLTGTIDHTTIEKISGNGFNTAGAGNAFFTVTNSNIVNVAGIGVNAAGAGDTLNIDLSSISNNNTGFSTSGGTIRITRNDIYDNNTNFTIVSGKINSSGNNNVAVNGATVPNGTVTQQ
jgi:hypothetical protein